MNTFSPRKKTRVKLEVRADKVFLPLVASFASRASTAVGLGEIEALHLARAAERVFRLLSEVLPPSKRVRISCVDGVYFVDQEFEFDLVEFEEHMSGPSASDPHQFLEKTDDIDLDSEIGLVDTFRFVQKRTTLCIVLRKHKLYPPISQSQAPGEVSLTGSFSVRQPDPHQLGLLALHSHQAYPLLMLHSSFLFPGKVVDMVASGDFFAVVAVDDRGNIGGGILGRWQGSGNRVVEFYGPYVFGQDRRQEVAQLLVDGTIEMLARTNTLALATLMPTPELPTDYFDAVGSLSFSSEQGVASVFNTYFRHLGEDPGSLVRVHQLLVPFVEEIYQRVALPRDVIVLQEYGESVPVRSILAADHLKFLSRVILRPMWFGRDAPDNLRRHLDTIRLQGYTNIFVEIDLGIPWHSFFVPAILDCGFRPGSILPYAGKGDLVIFEQSVREQ
jgi:hypothetical protein